MNPKHYGEIGYECGILEIGKSETIVKTLWETKRVNGIKVTVSKVAFVSVSENHLSLWEKCNSVVPVDLIFKLIYKKGFPIEENLNHLSIEALKLKTEIFLSEIEVISKSEDD